MNILVQFPTLGRPDQFLESFGLYLEKLSGKHFVKFNILCDKDDLTMQGPAFTTRLKGLVYENQQGRARHPTYDIYFDKNTTKIGAINSHIDTPDVFDIFICASDDMIPYKDNWDDIIATDMQTHYPDLDGALSYSDGRDIGNLITFSILGVGLYKHFGYIYHPDYAALYCDNEFTDVVNLMDKVTYIEENLIGHEHYAETGNRNSGKTDFAARKTLQFSGRDGIIYEKRKELGFPKERISDDI
jgi:hypothetical protein